MEPTGWTTLFCLILKFFTNDDESKLQATGKAAIVLISSLNDEGMQIVTSSENSSYCMGARYTDYRVQHHIV